MGGKRLKFPTRKKFISSEGEISVDKTEEKPISEEEKQKRLEHLKSLGLLK